MERAAGADPAPSALARPRSAAELRPLEISGAAPGNRTLDYGLHGPACGLYTIAAVLLVEAPRIELGSRSCKGRSGPAPPPSKLNCSLAGLDTGSRHRFAEAVV